MKKKIKDLTLAEANKICVGRKCDVCPLKDRDGDCILDILAGYSIPDIELEKEIEVNEDGN